MPADASVPTHRPEGLSCLTGIRVTAAREQVHHSLASAVGTGAFTYHFQPIVEISTGWLWGVEALMRWRDHDRWRPGADFIGVAASMGLLPTIAHECLVQLARDLPDLLADIGPTARVCVNIDPCELADEAVLAVLTGQTLAAHSRRIVLEMREIDVRVLRELGHALATLRETGYALAVDNAVGAPSQAMLDRIGPRVVKVDSRSMHPGHLAPGTLSGVAQQHATVHHAIAEACDAAQVASGVSSVELAIRALNSGVELGQGVLLAPPMSLVDLREWAEDRGAAHH